MPVHAALDVSLRGASGASGGLLWAFSMEVDQRLWRGPTEVRSGETSELSAEHRARRARAAQRRSSGARVVREWSRTATERCASGARAARGWHGDARAASERRPGGVRVAHGGRTAIARLLCVSSVSFRTQSFLFGAAHVPRAAPLTCRPSAALARATYLPTTCRPHVAHLPPTCRPIAAHAPPTWAAHGRRVGVVWAMRDA